MVVPTSPRFRLVAEAQAAATLMFDSLVNLSLLAATLLQFGFPPALLATRILPGSAMAVLLGNLGSAYLARRLRRSHADPAFVTALPFGLDTPSTLGVALGLLGPAFLAARLDARAHGLGPQEAAQLAAVTAWKLGSAVMVLVGLLKGLCALVAPVWARLLPAAAAMGALAGIGLMFLGLLPLLEIFAAPLVGLPALLVVLLGLIARRPLPYHVPAAAAAVAAGCCIYYGLGPLGVAGCGDFSWPHGHLELTLPSWSAPSQQSLRLGLSALPAVVPFALLTVVGGIANVAGARAAGDDYKVRDVLLCDALATLLSGCMGGVAQSTPYIGHGAYKKMGARTGYVLVAGLSVGFGGIVGAVDWAVDALPLAAIAPVMVYVGLEICGQAFVTVPVRHLPAVLLAFLPTLANLLLVRSEVLVARLQRKMAVALESSPDHGEATARTLVNFANDEAMQVLRVLGQGFLLTSLLWSTVLVQLIDQRPRRAAGALLLLAALSTCGAVHAPQPGGGLFWPWMPPHPLSFALSFGYCAAAALLLLLSQSEGTRLHWFRRGR